MAEVQHCMEVPRTAVLYLDNVGISVATQPCACTDPCSALLVVGVFSLNFVQVMWNPFSLKSELYAILQDPKVTQAT